MASTAVSVVSLLCSLLQLFYIVTILWLLRLRQKKLQVSANKIPIATAPNTTTALEPSAVPQHQQTLTQAGYYSNFLPGSFHSVVPELKESLIGGTSVTSTTTKDSELGFSYQTSHTPLESTTSVLSSSLNGPLHPDTGRMSFSASLNSGSHLADSSLYDEEDPFRSAKPDSQQNVTSSKWTPRFGPGATPKHASILEEEDEMSDVVMPAAATPYVSPSALMADSPDSDMQVSLDGDEPHPQNVEYVVDSATRHGQEGIQLESSRSPRYGSHSDSNNLSSNSGSTDGKLHLSGTPYAKSVAPIQSAAVGDGYLLMNDGGSSPDGHPSTARHAQSRHILHPKSSSYSRPDADGILHGAANGGVDFGNSNATISASKARRASLNRRIALASAKAQIAAAQTNKAGAKATRFTRAGHVAIPIRATVQDDSMGSIDPNASPVRAKVKFADSPRDVKAAQSLLASMKQPRLGDGSEIDENTESDTKPTKALVPSSSSTSSAASTSLVPHPGREPHHSVLKHRDQPPATTTPTIPEAPLLVLPIYYRFLVLQLVQTVVWCLACFILLAFHTNLVEWGSDQPSSPGRSWLFSLTMAVLMSVNAGVLDGLLVFLAAKNVGRASIRFSLIFGCIWGAINGIVVLIVIQTVSPPSNPQVGLLPNWHPFFIRSALALCLNFFILLSPNCLVCNSRARRSNLCRKSRYDRYLALKRQQLRWELKQQQIEAMAEQQRQQQIANAGRKISLSYEDLYSDHESTSDDFDPDDYDDDTQPRSTWLHFIGFNLIFHLTILLFYILDFNSVAQADGTWEDFIMWVLAFGYVVTTPMIYYCLMRDSTYWTNEWKESLTRMKAEAEAEEELRKTQKAEMIAKAKAEGRVIEETQLVSSSSSKPNPYAAFLTNASQNFFLDYSVLEYGPLLGSGGFSSVYAAKLWGSLDVAVKVLHVRDMSKEIVEQFLHEVGIVLQLHHPNVVQFLGVVFSPPDMVLVMERCRRQSLLHLIKHQKVRFTEFQAVSIGLAIADALRYIHEQDILHRDLKAANILFDLQGRPKICDFGLSEERSKIDLNRVFCGTLAYMSPEVLRSETVGKASDVYSFSIILWELLHNELAWKRGGPQKNGLNARMLVEMVAYRRARPPVKERLVDDHKVMNANGAGAKNAATTGASAVAAPKPYPIDSARIHPQAFANESPNGAPSPSPKAGSSATGTTQPRPGLHPLLVQLLRECWRDDYKRRPSFNEIVKRLSAFREMIRAQHQQH